MEQEIAGYCRRCGPGPIINSRPIIGNKPCCPPGLLNPQNCVYCTGGPIVTPFPPESVGDNDWTELTDPSSPVAVEPAASVESSTETTAPAPCSTWRYFHAGSRESFVYPNPPGCQSCDGMDEYEGVGALVMSEIGGAPATEGSSKEALGTEDGDFSAKTLITRPVLNMEPRTLVTVAVKARQTEAAAKMVRPEEVEGREAE